MDVHLSVSFLREQLGGTIEEAVRTAVETVLCETVRLLGGQLGDLLRVGPEKGQETQSLKLRLEACGGDWRVQPGDGGGICETDVGPSKRSIKSALSRTGCSSQKPLNNGGMPEPPLLVEHSDCGGFPDPFDMVSGGPTVDDFEDGQDMGLPTDWELMNRVYKAEHNEGVSLIDEGGATHYADEYLLQGRDLRIITVPLEEEMSELDTAEPEDPLPPFSPPAEVKKELPELPSIEEDSHVIPISEDFLINKPSERCTIGVAFSESCHLLHYSRSVGMKHVKFLGDEQTKLLSWRTGLTFEDDHTICSHHEQKILLAYPRLQRKCCDPFNKHKKPVKRSLIEITVGLAKIVKNTQDSNLVPGKKVCPTCYIAIRESTKSNRLTSSGLKVETKQEEMPYRLDSNLCDSSSAASWESISVKEEPCSPVH